MLTSELANRVGVTPETVRFYTRKGLLQPTKHPENGYNVYDKTDLNHLKFISHAKAIGFSLKEIQEIMGFSLTDRSPCPKVREMLGNKILETEQKIESLNKHLTVMKNAFSDWTEKPDMVPNGEAFCCLIDEWSKPQERASVKENNNE